jgi:hypothetical protein
MATILELADQLVGDLLNNITQINSAIPVVQDVVARQNLKTPLQGQINKSFSEAHNLGNLYDNEGPQIGERGGPYSAFTSPVPAQLRNFDIFAIANWLRNIGRETGIFPIQNNNASPPTVERTSESISKGITFLASQFLLASLNPGGIPIPGTADRQVFTNINPLNAVYNPLAIPTAAIPLLRGTNAAAITIGALASDYVTDISARLATNTDAMGLQEAESLALRGNFELPPSYPLGDAPGIGANSLDASFILETEDGVVPLVPLDDSILYMPFMFQDLRNTFDEFLYFKAFLKPGYTETFTPDWQLDRYYGRVEQIPTYMGTSRQIDLSFDIAAFNPSDLKVIYKKLAKLQSMVYPFYDSKGFLQSGPIIRMRVGDLFAADGGKGLPGYLTSLNFSFEDGIWNIKDGERVPRLINVSLSFTVLHEGNPGTYPYQAWSVDTAAGGTQEIIDGTQFGKSTFGAGKVVSDSVSTNFTVSTADIRKIFGGVK